MRRFLTWFCAVGVVLLLADVLFWGWQLGTRPEDESLPGWWYTVNDVTAYGALALFGVLSLIALVGVGAQVFRLGRRAGDAHARRRDLDRALRRS